MNWNGPQRVYTIVSIVVLLAVIIALTSCKSPRARVKDATATAPAQAGTPAVVNRADASTGIVIPPGTPVKMTKREAVPAVPATASDPGRPEDPAVVTYEFTPTAPTEIRTEETRTQASSGTVDTSVAKMEIKQKSKDKLLWFAAIAVVGALFFVWRGYPTGIYLCGIAAAIFFALWQISNLPDWMQFVGFGAVAGAVGIYFGYERKEKEHKENAQNAVR